MIKKIILTLIIVSLSSCTTFMYQELAYIHKNMTEEEVSDVVSSEEFDEGLSLISENTKDDIHKLSNGNMSILVTLKYYPMEEGHYVFLFQDNKLLYWGLPYEFTNNKNESIRKISPEITSLLEKNYIEEYD